MALTSLTDLDQFKVIPPLAVYPGAIRVFYSPVDNVHGALAALVASAAQSVVLCMYGYDDDELDVAIREKLDNEHVFVQLTLDKSQAGGVHEKAVLARWSTGDRNNSILVGTSEKGAIIHHKLGVVDGQDVIMGSTNWSTSGESKQDNHLVVIRHLAVAAEARVHIDAIRSAIRARGLKGLA
jgi:hypothetical protein